MESRQDQPRVEEAIAGGLRSRRGLVIGALRVAGGGGLALAAAGSPGLLRPVWAQDDDGGDDDDDDGGTTTVPAQRPAAAPTALPNTGAGPDVQTGGLTAALAGLAAIGAAATAFCLRRTA